MFEKKESNSINAEFNEDKSIDTTKYKISKPKKKNNVIDFDVIKSIKNNTGNPQETKDVDDLKNQNN